MKNFVAGIHFRLLLVALSLPFIFALSGVARGDDVPRATPQHEPCPQVIRSKDELRRLAAAVVEEAKREAARCRVTEQRVELEALRAYRARLAEWLGQRRADRAAAAQLLTGLPDGTNRRVIQHVVERFESSERACTEAQARFDDEATRIDERIVALEYEIAAAELPPPPAPPPPPAAVGGTATTTPPVVTYTDADVRAAIERARAATGKAQPRPTTLLDEIHAIERAAAEQAAGAGSGGR